MKSKYFTLAELCVTDTDLPNMPGWEQVDNLYTVTKMILDPLRVLHGMPIHINSGYRSPDVNKAIGGVPTSEHMQGMAVDLTGGDKTHNVKLFNLIATNFEFNQLIDEKAFTWIHVSFNSGKNKRQILHLP